MPITPSTPAIFGWPAIYLAARDLGLARYGNRSYRPEAWRKSVMKAVRDGRCIRFWWTTKGRPRKAVTTAAHLAAWAISGGHRALRRRRVSAARRDEA